MSDGNYTVHVTYLGDEKFNTNTTSVTFKVLETIKTTIVANKVSTVYKSGKYLVISLKDKNGNILTGVYFTVKIYGKTYTVKTNGWGQAKLSTNGHCF